MNVPKIVCDLGCKEQSTNDRGGQINYIGTVRTQDCRERPEEKVCEGQSSSATDTGEGQRVAIPSVGREYYDNRDDREPTKIHADYNKREVGECKKCSKREYQNKLDIQTDFSEPRRENTEDGRYVYCSDKIKATNGYHNENRVQRIDTDKNIGSSGSFDGHGLDDDNNRYNTSFSTSSKRSVIIYKCAKGCEKYDSGGFGNQDGRQGEERDVYDDRQNTPSSTPSKEIIYKCPKSCEKYDSGGSGSQDDRQGEGRDVYYDRQSTPVSTPTNSNEIIYKCPRVCEKYDSGGYGSQDGRQWKDRYLYHDKQNAPVSTPTKSNEIIYKYHKDYEKYDSGGYGSQDARQWKGGDLYSDRQNTPVSTPTKSNDIIYKCPKGCDKEDSDGDGIQDIKQKEGRYLDYGSEKRPVSPRAEVVNSRFPKNCFDYDSCHCSSQDVKRKEPYLDISGIGGRNDEKYAENRYNMIKKENSVNQSEENAPRNRCSKNCFHYDSGGCDKQGTIISFKCGCEGSGIREVPDTTEKNHSSNHSDLNFPRVHSQDNIRQTSVSISKTNTLDQKGNQDNIRQTSVSISKTNTLDQKGNQDENEMIFKEDFENPGRRHGTVSNNLGDCEEYCPSCLANQNAIGKGRGGNSPQFSSESSTTTSNVMGNPRNNRPSLIYIRCSRSGNVGGGHQSSSSRNSNTARNFVSGRGGNIEDDCTGSCNTDFNAPAVSRPSVGSIGRFRYRGGRCVGCGRALGTEMQEEDRGGCEVRRCGSFKCVERISSRIKTDAKYPSATEWVTALEITSNDHTSSTVNEDSNSLAPEPNTTCEPCEKPQYGTAFRSGRRYTARVQRRDYSSIFDDRASPCESYNRGGTRQANQDGRHAGGCAHTKRPRRICRG